MGIRLVVKRYRCRGVACTIKSDHAVWLVIDLTVKTRGAGVLA